MSISNVRNQSNYAALQNLFKIQSSNASQSKTGNSDPLAGVYSQLSSRYDDLLTISPEALKKLGPQTPMTEGASDGSDRKPYGSGQRMMSPADHAEYVKNNPDGNTIYERQNAEARAKFWAQVEADNPGVHHDTGEKNIDMIKAAMTKTSDTYYKHYKTPESLDQFTAQIQDRMNIIFKHEGIVLRDDEKFNITISQKTFMAGGQEHVREVYSIDGLEDKEKQAKIEFAINIGHVIEGKTFGMSNQSIKSAYYMNSDYAKDSDTYRETQHRGYLIDLKDRLGDMSDLAGVPIDFKTLHIDEDGKFQGYPKELEWVFTGDFSKAPSHFDDINKIQFSTQVLHPIREFLAAGYYNIPEMSREDVTFSFSNKEGLVAL